MRLVWVVFLMLIGCSPAASVMEAGADADADGSDAQSDVADVNAEAAPLPPNCDTAPCAADAGTIVQASWSFADNGQALTINRCDWVQWTNTDQGTPHSVVGVEGCFFDTGTNFGGALAPVRFTIPGTFPYFCSVHATTMKGTLTVK